MNEFFEILTYLVSTPSFCFAFGIFIFGYLLGLILRFSQLGFEHQGYHFISNLILKYKKYKKIRLMRAYFDSLEWRPYFWGSDNIKNNKSRFFHR